MLCFGGNFDNKNRRGIVLVVVMVLVVLFPMAFENGIPSQPKIKRRERSGMALQDMMPVRFSKPGPWVTDTPTKVITLLLTSPNSEPPIGNPLWSESLLLLAVRFRETSKTQFCGRVI
uniref:Uncharacterized protein n=1 Tax=Anopheles maculatus TaxID=74869 RepID=A0A182S798_9DIPT